MRFTIASMLSLAVATHAAIDASQMVSNIKAITDKSADTNDIAKDLSVTNVFTSTPQVISNFRDIITLVTNDISSMNSKRDLLGDEGRRIPSVLVTRQECLDVQDPEQCLEDLGETIEDPSEILGKRQECLDVQDVEQCIEDLGEIIEDPSEILGKRQDDPLPGTLRRDLKTRQAMYSDSEQSQVCTAFGDFVRVHQELLKTVIGKHGLLSLTPFTQPIAAVLRTLESGVDSIAFGIIDTVPTCQQSATQDKNSLDRTLSDAQDTYN